MANRESWIVDAVRTPVGRLGCANQAGEDNRNVARMAALLAQLPIGVSGQTINRLCGSGLQAVNSAHHAILAGDGSTFIAGGVESMSRAPYVMLKPETGYPRGVPEVADTVLGWRFVNPRMPEHYTCSLGMTAENVAERYGVGRREQDEFALESQRRAAAAMEAGRVGGTVTAGNSSGLNDGAAALLVMEAESARAAGLRPMARVLSSAVAGVEPDLMGLGPIRATRLALQRAGIGVDELKLVELNEAFAAQAIPCMRELGLDPEIVNVNGGAIALGHPLGCTGAKILTTLVHELRRRGGGYGLASMCIGVGQGIATVVEVMA